MKRGNIYFATISGDYGKPRPVVIVQRDHTFDLGNSVIVCPVTSHVAEDVYIHRISILPDSINGLSKPSQIMVDKIQTIRAERLRKKIGRLDDEVLLQMNRALMFWLGL